VRAEIPLHDLFAGRPRSAYTHDMVIHAADPTLNGTPIPLRIAPGAIGKLRVMFAGPRPYVVRPTHRADGEMAIDVIPVTPRRIARRLSAILRRPQQRAMSTTASVQRGQVVTHDLPGHDENALQTARRPSA